MARRVSLDQAEVQLRKLVRDIEDEEVIIIEQQGQPVAVLIRPEDFAHLREIERRELFALIDDIHKRNEDLDPDEVLREVTAAVEQVRQERYEQRRRSADRG